MFQLILCLSYLLASLERPTWNDEYTLHVFRSLLPFIASPKAKVVHCCCYIIALCYSHFHIGLFLCKICMKICLVCAFLIAFFDILSALQAIRFRVVSGKIL